METLQTFFHYLGCLVILLGIAVLGLAIARLGIAMLVGGFIFLVIEYAVGAVAGKETPDPDPDLGPAGAESYRRRHATAT